ncbi:MAG: hypothetical protein JWM36_3924 [Hyphomicrobiales bacterium]|nr:hypothetical protein [Hyphomicrobiales bacterium]
MVIYTNDHRPPHVHVFGAEYEATFLIENGVELRENFGFSRSQLILIGEELEKVLPKLNEKWRDHHG